MVGDRTAGGAERIVAQDARFGGDRRADGGVEHGAPADAAALGRGSHRLLAGIGFLLVRQIALEFLVVLGIDLGAAARIVGGCGSRGKLPSFGNDLRTGSPSLRRLGGRPLAALRHYFPLTRDERRDTRQTCAKK
jgi:hypothetical protein